MMLNWGFCFNNMRNEKGQFVKGVKFTEEYKRKRIEARKGYRHTEETKRKIGKGNKNKIRTIETREKISEAQKGRIPWNKGTKGVMKPNKTSFKKGEKNRNWNNGSSFEPYGLEFNEGLKEVIRNRDRRKCQICEKTELEDNRKLSIHHIDYNKNNNDPKNLISLCKECHAKTNHNRDKWINYFKSK